jgi:hypothetical protein
MGWEMTTMNKVELQAAILTYVVVLTALILLWRSVRRKRARAAEGLSISEPLSRVPVWLSIVGGVGALLILLSGIVALFELFHEVFSEGTFSKWAIWLGLSGVGLQGTVAVIARLMLRASTSSE